MRFMVVGLNHVSAPVEVRERVSISDIALDQVLETLRNTRTVLESVVVSTCNRTEVYCVVNSEHAGADYLTSLLSRLSGIDVGQLKSYLYIKSGQEAVHHLFRVTCGLDSMMIGETQILGQVRSAYLTAVDSGNVGALLNYCFRLAVQTGKQAQTSTGIGQNAVSVSYAAVQLAKKIVGDLSNHRALVVGLGKMGSLALNHIYSSGATDITLVNRTLQTAKSAAADHGAKARPWEELPQAVEKADVVIVSTGSKEYVITESMIAKIQRKRNHRPLVLIDIAVPRNIDPGVGNLREVYYFDIDDLNGVVAANLEERRRAGLLVERMIASAMSEFADWLSAQSVVPVIAAIRQKGEDVEGAVMESLRRKLPHLTDKDFSLIHKHTMSVVNQLLRDPIRYMKEETISSGGAKDVEAFAKLFGVDDKLPQPETVDMMDGYKVESAAEGFARLAFAIRSFCSRFIPDELNRADDTTDSKHQLQAAQ